MECKIGKISHDEIKLVIKITEDSINKITESTEKFRFELKEYEAELSYLDSVLRYRSSLTCRTEICEQIIMDEFQDISEYSKNVLSRLSVDDISIRINYIEQQKNLINHKLTQYQKLNAALITDIKLLKEIDMLHSDIELPKMVSNYRKIRNFLQRLI
ncbi:hypothetical protein [Vibrio ziniensis]|uniref:Uncharacterized protein n=1 Tax=Vibrio ziniensis TaxID=2711221 RepID=A0A6G7CPU7_9VIBR|nr:hypothetical protein [Vibrio ziniensis]QIH44167.1 hypothetical protein G5S32_19605 [Vibrio ziniensis]